MIRPLLVGAAIVSIAAFVLRPAASQPPPAPPKPDAKKKAEKPKKQTRPLVTIVTDRGEIVLELYPDEAPKTVSNFVALIKRGFYDGLTFHRVEPGFVVQGGDPNGNGTGGPGYTIPSESNTQLRHTRGAVGMANSGKDTAGSQFYIVTGKDAFQLDNGLYTLFARVLGGQDVAEALRVGDKMTRVTVVLPPSFKPRPFGPSRRAEPSGLVYPELPDDVRTRRYGPTVRVSAQIAIDGKATVTLERGSGDARVDAAILAAIRAWTWAPALKDGQPVASRDRFDYDLATHSRRYDGQ